MQLAERFIIIARLLMRFVRLFLVEFNWALSLFSIFNLSLISKFIVEWIDLYYLYTLNNV